MHAHALPPEAKLGCFHASFEPHYVDIKIRRADPNHNPLSSRASVYRPMPTFNTAIYIRSLVVVVGGAAMFLQVCKRSNVKSM